jgi:3-phosphoglycerate kinase
MGEALLLENLRFHHEEEANDRDFSHELARGKQAYVNDGVRHGASRARVDRWRHPLPRRARGGLS